MQACGLKPVTFSKFEPLASVTPHAGVWIETLNSRYNIFIYTVTPHAGVWIETKNEMYNGYKSKRHASCRRVDWNL